MKEKESTLLSLEYRGAFSSSNTLLVDSLDKEVLKNFSVDLRAKEGDSKLIPNAALALGYLNILCSSSKSTIAAEATTVYNGVNEHVDSLASFLEKRFRLLLFRRLAKLLEGVMVEVRAESPQEIALDDNLNIPAAAAILHYGVEFFTRSLGKGGHLQLHVSRLLFTLVREVPY